MSEKATKAAQIMKSKSIGSVPVVKSEQGELVGIVTDRDLCLEIVAEGKNPSSVSVGQCMSKNPVAAHADDHVDKIGDLMKHHQVRRIPVVDSSNRVIGIIATADVAREGTTNGAKTSGVFQAISQP